MRGSKRVRMLKHTTQALRPCRARMSSIMGAEAAELGLQADYDGLGIIYYVTSRLVLAVLIVLFLAVF